MIRGGEGVVCGNQPSVLVTYTHTRTHRLRDNQEYVSIAYSIFYVRYILDLLHLLPFLFSLLIRMRIHIGRHANFNTTRILQRIFLGYYF